MKNKLLVTLFAAVVAFAFTACKNKSDVLDVNSDLVKVTMHKSARSLVELKGETLSITEYEFSSPNVDDNRLMLRTISFGNGTYSPKNVETMTYEYGAWNENYTAYSLLVSPASGAPYTMWFGSNAFKLPDGRVVGGEGSDNTARVEKWEKTLLAIQNTQWEGVYRAEFVLDSVYRDSIRTRFIPPMTFITDTIKVFDHMDTVSADTTCRYMLRFDRDAATLANTGHFLRVESRTEYDKATHTCDTIIGPIITEFDGSWYFSSVSSDSKFNITFVPNDLNAEEEVLAISKFRMGDPAKPDEFLYKGATFSRIIIP